MCDLCQLPLYLPDLSVHSSRRVGSRHHRVAVLANEERSSHVARAVHNFARRLTRLPLAFLHPVPYNMRGAALPMNIVIISADILRTDYVGCYPHCRTYRSKKVQTPNLADSLPRG